MKMFHVHIDAQSLSTQFERYLIDELGFWRSDFSGHPEGREHFEPVHHLTCKSSDTREYRAIFDKAVAFAESHDGMEGYIEAEFVALDKEITYKPYDPAVSPPFQLSMKFLEPDCFRETEIHITLSRNESDQRLLEALSNMGFFCAYLLKEYGEAAIFTVQGSREVIDQILPATIEYLESAGGAVECTIKEERITHWWLKEPDVARPPVIEKISWQR